MTESTTLAVGSAVVIQYGPTSEETWDDSGADITGTEGVLVRVLGPQWPSPFEVRTPDGRNLFASQIRANDDAYRAEKAAEKAADDRLDLRRLRLLDDALSALRGDQTVPGEIRERLYRINVDTAQQAWREERAEQSA